ncbi:gastrula zinc finger protein XlCGF57.1 [Octopus sinensis]|uniref:Gastrula zinc finger protein XlCGF57.1 n=1 Tax=Octopus sinensis TaxID=2607531 RepID=A0A6P7TCZ4_9MOLL|nr:gastrula zinc finger protein XlCGF57.1 [Octopus sinensis]
MWIKMEGYTITSVEDFLENKDYSFSLQTKDNDSSEFVSVEDERASSPEVIIASSEMSNSKQVHPLNKPYQCDLCPKMFTKPFYLNLHRKVHSKPPKVYQCFECKDIFSTQGKLAHHEKSMHKNKVVFPCEQCDQVFPLFRAYVTHQKTHSNEKSQKCDMCDKAFAYSSQLAAHMRVHTGERPFQCKLCQKKFTYSGHLTVHMRSHTGDRPYKCEHCGKSFTQSSDLTHHAKIHSGVKPHICDICSKSFTHAGQLIVHLRKHSGERPYRCEHCHKSFAQSSHLTLHIRSHTGEKPFKCDHCEKSFVDSSHLAVHTRTHTGEKPFQCTFPGCNRFFARSSQLAKHKRCCHYNIDNTDKRDEKGKLRPYRCTFCPKSFIDENHLDAHTRVHTGERPFACNFCEKKFVLSAHLTTHMRVHTGTKPFKCQDCSKVFTQSGNLALHRKSAHCAQKENTAQKNKIKHKITADNKLDERLDRNIVTSAPPDQTTVTSFQQELFDSDKKESLVTLEEEITKFYSEQVECPNSPVSYNGTSSPVFPGSITSDRFFEAVRLHRKEKVLKREKQDENIDGNNNCD